MTRTRIIGAVALVPSLLSLVWTAWSVADMIPAPLPVGLAAGALLDLVLIGSVVIAWTVASVARPAALVGWVAAALASVALAVHGWQIAPGVALLAVAPLVSKALWHLALIARRAEEVDHTRAEELRAAEEAEQAARAAELSDDLTDDQRRELANIRRTAAYTRARTDAERDLSDAEHAARLEEIDRRAAEQMALDRAAAEIDKQRHALAREVHLASPVTAEEAPAPALPAGVSRIDQARPGAGAVGFGAAIVGTARGAQAHAEAPEGITPTVDAGSRQIVTEQRSGAPEEAPRPVDTTSAVEARRARGRSTRDKVRAYAERHPAAGPAEVARAVGVSPSTARRHLTAVRTEQQQ